MARVYDHKAIEKKWQALWDTQGIYVAPDHVDGKENLFTLVEYPYPSGDLHVGHWYAFSVPDMFARMMRMKGKNVLFPIGFDSFGLPAENAAIKDGANPKTWTEANIERMRGQLRSMGNSFDWTREVSACDPKFYRFTQKIFLELLAANKAYRKKATVNWCPKDMTVLANEQVIEGKCERCDSPVEKKEREQWFLKITDYADRLIDDLEPLNWPESIKDAQRNWIGRSEGSVIQFPLPDSVKRVVILHGRMGHPESVFIPWLSTVLRERGYEVIVPSLPNTNEPNDDEQAGYVEKNVTLDETTAIIGHSFGGIVALRLLERGARVARVSLVATPFSGIFLDGKVRESVSKAVRKGFDAERVRRNAREFTLLYDSTDDIVPVSDGYEYQKLTQGTLAIEKSVSPHFLSKREPRVLQAAVPGITVFTTRPDTLFGATYLVLAPEHELVKRMLDNGVIKNASEVTRYIVDTLKKSELERQQQEKRKTGVELKGVRVTNPATMLEIPVFIADYVLHHYGTGAVMAVPAHDDRDYEFANAYSLPITQVVAPYVIVTGKEGPRSDDAIYKFSAATAIVKHWDKDLYYVVEFSKELHGFVGGHIQDGETPQDAALREVREESGYTDIESVREVMKHAYSRGYKTRKSREEECHDSLFYVKLRSGERRDIEDPETKMGAWRSREEVESLVSMGHHRMFFDFFVNPRAFTDDGVLVESGQFSGYTSEEARRAITEHVHGDTSKNFKLRDWLVSRQRYWGAPIPVVYDPNGVPHRVPDEHLPWLLPTDVDFTPTGIPPLQRSRELKERVERIFGSGWTPDPDTLDTFVDSSWYYLRYLDPNNASEFSSLEMQKAWLPVSRYSGGSEHTTVHVLYSRFIAKALYDLGFVAVNEPYKERVNRGLIMAEDGRKMSKRWKNVVNPDEHVQLVGADAVRTYLAFIGPYNVVGSFPWSTNGLIGVRKFLERVYGLLEKVSDSPVANELDVLLNQTISRVEEDIQSMKFNTAVSQLMILSNALQKGPVPRGAYETLIKLLAPFAPHLADEIWHELGNDTSVHQSSWPVYDASKLTLPTVTVAVQINGKTRGTVSVSRGAEEREVLEAIRGDQRLSKAIDGHTRTIFVIDKIVNFMVPNS